jgi:hypothetical protein
LAWHFFGIGEVERSRTIYQSLATREDGSPILRLMARDGHAIANLVLVTGAPAGESRTGLLSEADEATRAVLLEAGLLPAQIPSFLATRAAVRVLLGDWSGGAALLERVQSELNSPKEQAICACYLALACARLGDREQSQAYLEHARALDGNSLFLAPTLLELEMPAEPANSEVQLTPVAGAPDSD